jgi:hypothetical protein
MVGLYQRANEHDIGAIVEADAYQHRIWCIEGNWDAAERGAETVLHRPQGHENWHIQAQCTLASIASNRGHFNRTRSEIAAVLTEGPATKPGRTRFLESQMLQRLAATIALDTGDLPTARAWLEAHDRWLQWSGAVLGRAEGALGWAQYHHGKGDAVLARAAAEEALANASEPRQPLVLNAVHRFLGQLDTEAAQFEAAEKHLGASLKLAEACAAPFERALTLLEVARLRVAEEKVAEAATLLAEVRGICEPLGARPTLARAAELERSFPSDI